MTHGTEEHLEHAEHAKHAAHDPFDRRVAMTMAVIAAVLACVTMLSHREHNNTLLYQTEANVLETKASDKWSYFQAKKNRAYMYAAYAEELPILAKDGSNANAKEQATKLRAKYQKTAEKYQEDAAELQAEATKLQEESRDAEKASGRAHARADRFDYGELGVEVALVFCSIAVLTKNPNLWLGGIVICVIGLGAAISAFFMA